MNRISIILLFISFSLFSQNKEPYTFGELSSNDYQITVYDKDSTANAVFLYERGKTTFHQTRNDIVIRTKYYAKVKIFNKEGVKKATIEIPIYKNKSSSERVKDIKAITHNGKVKTYLSKDHIYTNKLSDNWSQVSFTMPAIEDQSIIEYEYVLESPFKFNFQGWEFQTDIPKIYSEFNALIPGNYLYNRKLLGLHKLAKNESKIKSNCFSISGISGSADCEQLLYAMKDIPAFIEEDYMTSKKNFLSKIKFELSEFRGFNGENQKFSKTWRDVDREFRGEKSIGRQLRKIDYVEKNLPTELVEGEATIEKAKKVYTYIKNHFTWNGKYRVFKDVSVKEALEQKVGNSMEINIALINALNACGLDAELMLVSTRNNGLPTKLYPVLTDFNYGIAKLNIGENSYLLDATDKKMPFDMLPFKILNSYGRVMNFKKGSYWYNIISKVNSVSRVSLNLKLNEEGDFKGLMNISSSGYKALNRRNKFYEKGEDDYLNEIESSSNDLSILSYKNTYLDDFEKPFNELFEIDIESNLNGSTLILNPFLVNKLKENPFKLKERLYPVDFGYPFQNMFTLSLEIPDNYKIKSLPENVALKLPDNAGIFTFNVEVKDNKITMMSRVNIYKPKFSQYGYHYLKEFYNQIIKTHKSLITLEKNN